MSKTINSRIPEGPVAEKWKEYKAHQRLVNPKNKLKLDVIVVGTGLAGASAAASLGEMGFNVYNFCIQDSPRRAHSIAAQGGINAAKCYQNDGDSIYRLFYDTVKGGDYRAREANVYRLAEVSNNIIDQCVAQGVPFAREYGGMLANRSFGGAQVSRTFYAKGQTGQQLLLGAYSSLSCQVISNVPSAILLSRFTADYQDLLVGVNIGGCGTLIASLASLITFREYKGFAEYQTMFTEDLPGHAGRVSHTSVYIAKFSAFNFAFLGLLLGFMFLLKHLGWVR